MTLKGWYKESENEAHEGWLNNWFPYLDASGTIKNRVDIIRHGKTWVVYVSSYAPYNHVLDQVPSKDKARKIAVRFMKKYPGGHPDAIKKLYPMEAAEYLRKYKK